MSAVCTAAATGRPGDGGGAAERDDVDRDLWGACYYVFFFYSQFWIRGYRLRAPKSGDGVRIPYLYLIARLNGCSIRPTSFATPLPYINIMNTRIYLQQEIPDCR